MTTQTNGAKGEILTTQPSSRIKERAYIAGKQPGVRVAMREVQLTPTRIMTDGSVQENPPLVVYDPSGPYTDPNVTIDIRKGLTPLRSSWILGRGDVEKLPDISSDYGRRRALDPKLSDLRFQHIRKPLRAENLDMNAATQMHYARKGIITPEMEYIAIRENQTLALAKESKYLPEGPAGKGVAQHPGNSWGLLSHPRSLRNSSAMKSRGERQPLFL